MTIKMELENIQIQLNRIEAGLSATKNVLTFDEAVQFTGLSKSYMYKLTSSGEIPHFKPRQKLIYFERMELEKWLLQNRVKTTKEINQEATTRIVTGKKGGRN
ncbi:MAG: helix-turn-helix domain-containing protein [Anaerovoracaceae bacterium]